MSLLSFLFGPGNASANVAKQRLQRVLAAESSPRSARRPEYFPALQRELLGVVSKYVKCHPRDIKVRFERDRESDVIRVKIELRQRARA